MPESDYKAHFVTGDMPQGVSQCKSEPEPIMEITIHWEKEYFELISLFAKSFAEEHKLECSMKIVDKFADLIRNNSQDTHRQAIMAAGTNAGEK